MKRLLKISINLAIGSIIPILCWFCIGELIDKELVNIFTVTYPLQFLFLVLIHWFGTGANINKCKNKESKNNIQIVDNNIIVGSIVSIIIYGILMINVDKYLSFMNYNNNNYEIFTIYSMAHLGLSVIFYLITEKMYFEDEEDKASKHTIIFNILTFIVLIGSSVIFTKLLGKNNNTQIIIAIITLLIDIAYILYLLTNIIDKTFNIKNILHLELIKNFKYDSSKICAELLFILIMVFGLRNANSFGMKYTAAINFVALITDTQWDSLSAITTVAKIDIAKGRFNYKKHLIDAYKLTGIIVLTSIIMLISLFKNYDLNLVLVLIYFSFEIFNFMIFAKYATDNVIIQLEYSALASTVVKISTSVIRFIISAFLITPFCTGIAQVVNSALQFITFGTIKNKMIKRKELKKHEGV